MYYLIQNNPLGNWQKYILCIGRKTALSKSIAFLVTTWQKLGDVGSYSLGAIPLFSIPFLEIQVKKPFLIAEKGSLMDRLLFTKAVKPIQPKPI